MGLSIAMLLSQRNRGIYVDVFSEKVAKINRKDSPIVDVYLENSFWITPRISPQRFVSVLNEFADEVYMHLFVVRLFL